MNPSSAVWITGIGTWSAAGGDLASVNQTLLSGRSTIAPITRFGVENHPSQIGGSFDSVPCPAGEDAEGFARLPRLEKLVRHCCSQALHHSGLFARRKELRIGVVLGIGVESILLWEEEGHNHSVETWQPILYEESMLERTRKWLHLSGPGITVAAACASGNVALSQARAWLRQGWVDVCLAGACDAAVSPLSLAAFGNLRALSRRNSAPRAASRPFDKDRDGFVLSEGGAVFVLERADDARRRSASAFAEIAGYGAASDAHHLVIPSPDPGPASVAVQRALDDARINANEVDYINAHATSTPVGDAAEARVLHKVLGAAVQTVPVSSTKSITGHLLNAAAAFEVLACIGAMQANALPPTINLDQIDSECALCHVANQTREKRVKVAMSNSFGFGGSNTSLVLRAVA
jgi:3-oxoacyl-[acyl-carrier-protein] synthase II